MNNKLLFRIGIVAMSAMLAVAVYLALVFYPFLTEAARDDIDVISVSYTHLTLPTTVPV